MSIMSILSGQGSLVGMERFAKRHRQAFNELLGTDFAKSPSDSTLRLLLAQLVVEGLKPCCATGWPPSRAWQKNSAPWCVMARPYEAIDENASGAARFNAKDSLYSQSLGVAIDQTTYATDARVRSRPCARCCRQSNLKVCWCRPTRCTRTVLFPLPRPARR